MKRNSRGALMLTNKSNTNNVPYTTNKNLIHNELARTCMHAHSNKSDIKLIPKNSPIKDCK